MTKSIDLTSTDPIINSLKFRPHRNDVQRRFERFVPKSGEPQTMEVPTSWGETLTAKPGDYLVGPMDDPNDRWPVDAEIFEGSYEIVGPNACVKTAITELVPLIEVTNGDVDQMVTVHTMEGPETVRAGDFFLARGIKGEIWPYPMESIAKG